MSIVPKFLRPKGPTGYIYSDDKDMGLHNIEPGTKHPEQAVWKKSCDVCACRNKSDRIDPSGSSSVTQNIGESRTEAILRNWPFAMNYSGVKQMLRGERPFFCHHRKDEDGFYRVCAAAHVKYGPGRRKDK